MKKAVLLIPVVLIAVAMLATPVLAIGPFQALNKNEKFTIDPFGGLVSWRKDDRGYITWSPESEGDYWMEWRFLAASSGEGKKKDALVFTLATLAQFAADEEAYADGLPTVNENKWIFVDPDVKLTHPVYGEHGMVWWMYYVISGGNKSVADLTEARYPDGAFWQYNFIG
jgi:hypothetical protein